MSDQARIVSSLFNTPQSESYIAHVQTFEEVSGSNERKPRYLILSSARDTRLKLHKAKQNANGTFSIGKTWALEELRSVEVSKPLEFTLVINGKTYKYETALPTALQATFLVTLVRCWRKYMAGRGAQDLILVGFSVDNPAAARPSGQPTNGSNRPSATKPPSSSQSNASQGSQSFSRDREFSNSGQSSYSRSTSNQSNINQPQALNGRSASSQSIQVPTSPSFPPPPRPGTSNSTHSYTSNSQSNRRAPSPTPSSGSARRPSAAPSISSMSLSAPPNQFGGNSRTQPSASQPQSRVNPTGPSTSSPSRNGSNISLPPSSSSRPGIGDARSKSPSPSIAKSIIAPSLNDRTASSSSRSPKPISIPLDSPPMDPGDDLELDSAFAQHTVEEMIDEDMVLANVEEMLEGFEWRGGGGGSSGWGGAVVKRGGKGDEIEKRLVGELKALEAASIHAIIESDDRVNFVIQHLDDALAELERMDLTIGMYSTQLSLMADDIAHIEGQGRGLQVQTSNQRTLLAELDTLMQTIHIPEGDLNALAQESLENPKGIERLERAAVSVYKALLSTRDTPVGDMAAASERVEEYRAKASQFCKRLFDFLSIMFRFQVDQLVNRKTSSVVKAKSDFILPSHASMEDFLGRYCGLMLFVKEIDQNRYQQICAAYFTSMSELHRVEVQDLLAALKLQIRKPTEEDLEANFSTGGISPALRQGSIRRVGTVIRSPLEGPKKDKESSGKLPGSEAFQIALGQITPHVGREQGFISDLLHINSLDASITFADYMMLDSYFRRGATSYLSSQQGKLKDIRSAMEMVFGFLGGELGEWINHLLQKDNMQIIGVLAALDQSILKADQERNDFLLRALLKQHGKTAASLEKACTEQIKSIEQTKVTLKKRKGVVPFVRVFPLFVARVEAQLEGAENLKIRTLVNSNYERISGAMFESLQQMAKMDGEGQGVSAEDKDQLNYHVIIIENMHHLVTVFSNQRIDSLTPFVDQAKDKYSENLNLYIKLVLRRPLARLLDFFQGLEQLLRTTPPTEVSLHSAYTKTSLRKATSSLTAKDLRKAVEQLYKRVDKHFGDSSNSDPEDVLKTVWKACEEEVTGLTMVWKGLIGRCYPEEKGLEFTREEVQLDFNKAATQ